MTKQEYSTDLFAARAAIDAEIERLDHLIELYESGPRSIGRKEYRKNSRRFYELCDERDDIDDAATEAPVRDLDEMSYKAKVLSRVLKSTPPERSAEILRQCARELLDLADAESRKGWIYFKDAVGSQLCDLQGF